MTRRLLPGLLALSAAGCATDVSSERSEPELHVAVPETWKTPREDTTADSVVGQWWRGFEDEQLTGVVLRALERNHDLAAAAARVEAAASQARIAGAPLYPAIDAFINASRQRQVFVGLPIPGGAQNLTQTYNQFGVGLRISWELDVWGRVAAGERAALADLEAVAQTFSAARDSLAAQTARAYLAALEARLQVELAERARELFRLSADQVRARFERGIRPAVELRLALTTLAQSEALLEQQRERRELVRRQLELLLGNYPEGAITTATDLPALPPTVPVGLPAQLLLRRHDVLAAERQLAANAERVEQARAALFPRLALTASAGTASDEFEDLIDSDLFVWSVAGNLVQPLFVGGELRERVELARAQAREAAAIYASTALNAYTEVESTLASERLLRNRERALGDAVEQATAARVLAEERYARGVQDFLTMLSAQQREVETRVAHLTSRRLILDARIDLHLALGGGFEAPPAGETQP